MKAVVKYGQEDGMVEIRDVPIPEIGPNDFLVEVQAAGVCGSDIEMWRHHFTYKVNTPVIMGHEFCGVVSRCGESTSGFQIGERVISETSAYVCGNCLYCRTGDYNLCASRLGYGYGTDGAFTKYVKVRKEILHHLPEGVSFEEAAVIEPICVAYNAVAVRSRIKPGDTVVIIGPGPIGLNCIQIARIAGAGNIIATGVAVDADRLKLARGLGADITINVQEEDITEKIMHITDGVGADLVIDAAGNADAFRQSLAMVRRLGQVTKIGWGPAPINMSLDPLLTKSVTLQGTYGHNWDTWKHVLKLVETGKVTMKLLISDILPITEWEKAYRLVEDRKAVKVILQPVD